MLAGSPVLAHLLPFPSTVYIKCILPDCATASESMDLGLRELGKFLLELISFRIFLKPCHAILPQDFGGVRAECCYLTEISTPPIVNGLVFSIFDSNRLLSDLIVAIVLVLLHLSFKSLSFLTMSATTVPETAQNSSATQAGTSSEVQPRQPIWLRCEKKPHEHRYVLDAHLLPLSQCHT